MHSILYTQSASQTAIVSLIACWAEPAGRAGSLQGPKELRGKEAWRLWTDRRDRLKRRAEGESMQESSGAFIAFSSNCPLRSCRVPAHKDFDQREREGRGRELRLPTRVLCSLRADREKEEGGVQASDPMEARCVQTLLGVFWASLCPSPSLTSQQTPQAAQQGEWTSLSILPHGLPKVVLLFHTPSRPLLERTKGNN
mmetsp:Transcript_26884/g.52789  ORF Transcript_26884/g.52789 Transcript_26884/m.52789 type:complete len:198 (-) Transcript_26884:226-819(-)